MNSYVLSNVVLVDALSYVERADILITDAKIAGIGAVGAFAHIKNQFYFQEPIYVLPGFIDLHIHGASGFDVMDATPDALDAIGQSIARQGTTAYLATTMTAPNAQIVAALQNIADYQSSSVAAKILGVHLEGPFLAPQAAGAQNAADMQAPDISLLRSWQQIANSQIRLLTLAPEYTNALEFIQQCVADGIVVSIGHTDASAERVNAAIAAGASYATHLFNAMSGLHHRQSGAAYPLLLAPEVMAELIADGLHVSPWALRLAWEIKQAENLVLVSDAMRARCMPCGSYHLGGQAVELTADGCARLADGTLAGSVLDQITAARHFMSVSGCSLQDISRMCSYNPAQQLSLSNSYGLLQESYVADIVLLDHDLSWCNTICSGVVLDRNKLSNSCNRDGVLDA